MKQKRSIPVKLIALDFAGALLIAAAILLLLGDTDPQAFIYLALGFLLMVPLIAHILGNLSAAGSSGAKNGD